MAFGRFAAGRSNVLGFSVPTEVLTLLGISLGSAVVAGAVKTTKSTTRPECVAAYPIGQERGRFLEMLTSEEGASAGKTMDVTMREPLATASVAPQPTSNGMATIAGVQQNQAVSTPA